MRGGAGDVGLRGGAALCWLWRYVMHREGSSLVSPPARAEGAARARGRRAASGQHSSAVERRRARAAGSSFVRIMSNVRACRSSRPSVRAGGRWFGRVHGVHPPACLPR